jgi:dimethylargininase
VGLSSRSNAEGIEELRVAVSPFGYTVTPVAVNGCLHLKSACVALSPVDLFADPTRVDTAAFRVDRILIVPPNEKGAADALAIGDTVLIDAGYPTTHALLVDAGYNVRELDLSEFAKAEAGPTCLSLIFETQQSTVDSPQSTVENHNAATSAPRPKRRSRT